MTHRRTTTVSIGAEANRECLDRPSPFPRTMLVASFFLATLVGALPAPSYAASGVHLQLPANNVRPRSGLRLELDTHWVDGFGYRPIRLTLATANGAPSPSNRELQVDFFPHESYNGQNDMGVRQTIRLSEGKNRETSTILVPQFRHFTNMRLDVRENGRRIRELCVQNVSTNQDQWTERSPRILFIDSNVPTRLERMRRINQYQAGNSRQEKYLLPNLRRLFTVIPQNNYNSRGNFDSKMEDDQLLSLVTKLQCVELRPPAELPTNWLEYSALDVVFLSQADLQQIIRRESAKWSAIRSFVCAGGVLCVHGAGADPSARQRLDQLLAIASPDAGTPTSNRWQEPLASSFKKRVAVFTDYGRNRRSDAGVSRSRNANSGDSENVSFFSYRPMMLGTVVLFGPRNPFPGTHQQWAGFFNTLTPSRFLWYERHGLSLRRQNDDYWNFLIPGVGMAPVGAFRVLITIFVICIGPLNYFFFRRRGRLNWLLFTIPLGAFFVTASLFAYALIGDGLSIRGRIRSFTHIDQRTNQVVSWSRQAYYAGLAPSQGLNFPTDTAVYPLQQHPSTSEYGRRRGLARRVAWADNQQNLSDGYIASRIQSQMMVIRSGRSSGRLVVSNVASDRGAPMVRNQLGARAVDVFVATADGSLLAASDIDDKEQKELHPIAVSALRSRLRNTYMREPLEPPPDFDARAVGRLTMDRYSYYYYQRFDQGLPNPREGSSVLERRLRRVLLEPTLRNSKPLEPNGYLAIVDRAPGEVPLGVNSVIEEGSLHVVTGVW